MGAPLMELVNFLVGVASQETSALLTIWYEYDYCDNLRDTFSIQEWKKMRKDFKENPLNRPDVHFGQRGLDGTPWPNTIDFDCRTISESSLRLRSHWGPLSTAKRSKHQLAGIAMTVIRVFALTANT